MQKITVKKEPVPKEKKVPLDEYEWVCYNEHCEKCGDTLITNGKVHWCSNPVCSDKDKPIRLY